MKNKKFLVGTFNLYNLALPNIAFHNGQIYSRSEYEKKKKWIRQQLERMSSDLIGFQEVIHEQALKEILTEVEGYENAQLIIAPNDNQSTVAFLSKFPILNYQVQSDFPSLANFNVQGIEIPFEHTPTKSEIIVGDSLAPRRF